MRFFALATDYDGTLARHGEVKDSTIAALRRLRASGRKVLLVTGRELPDLQTVFPHLDLFDLVVAENGALLYFPKDQREQTLGEAPSEQFLLALGHRDVSPLSVGRVIVASAESESVKILDAIKSLGLELQVIFNKGSLMVLPSGVNKATGLAVALDSLGLSPHNVVGVGDAENDHALLRYCECGVAVANALPALKNRADIVTRASHGDGVMEVIDGLIADDLAGRTARLSRHDILLGPLADRGELRIPAYGRNVMVAEPASNHAPAVALAFVERLLEQRYQVCVVDPEGRLAPSSNTIRLGDSGKVPTMEEAIAALDRPEQSLVINLASLSAKDRPGFFESLVIRLQGLRGKVGRPHWLVVQDAVQVLPPDGELPPLEAMIVTNHSGPGIDIRIGSDAPVQLLVEA